MKHKVGIVPERNCAAGITTVHKSTKFWMFNPVIPEIRQRIDFFQAQTLFVFRNSPSPKALPSIRMLGIRAAIPRTSWRAHGSSRLLQDSSSKFLLVDSQEERWNVVSGPLSISCWVQLPLSLLSASCVIRLAMSLVGTKTARTIDEW